MYVNHAFKDFGALLYVCRYVISTVNEFKPIRHIAFPDGDRMKHVRHFCFH